MGKKKELLKNTIIIFIGKISTQFLSFFLLPLYTSYLTTSDYGTVDLIITYISLFIPIITLQQEMATFRYLIDERKNTNKIKSIISTSIYNVLKLLLVFLVIYFIVIQIFDIKYKYYILINIIICIFSNLFLQITRGLGKNINYSIASFVTGFITLLSNIILIVVFSYGAKGMLISMSLANITCIIYLFISLKLYKFISYKYNNKDLQKEMLKYSIPLVPNNISWWIINASDRTIISLFLGVSQNGIYAVANKFSSIISSLFSIFSMSWTESASLHINDDDRDEFFSGVAETVIKLFSCLCIAIIAFMPFIFNIIIKKSFIDAYQYIPIFMLGSICHCIVGVYSSIYIAKKMTKQVATTSILSAIINIVFNILFIRYIGLYASCISTVLAYFSMMIYRHFDLKKYVKVKYNTTTIIAITCMFVISMCLYYQNNLILNIVNLCITILFSIYINKNIIKSIYINFKKKIYNKHM